jgi:hypothetical protein
MIRAGTRKAGQPYAIYRRTHGEFPIDAHVTWSWIAEGWIITGPNGDEFVEDMPNPEHAEMVCVYEQIADTSSVYTLAVFDGLEPSEDDTLKPVWPFYPLMRAMEDWLKKRDGSIAQLKRLLRR